MDGDIDFWIRQQVSRSEILSRERETELLDAWLDRGEIAARDELVLAHQKLVAGMATKFSSSGANFSDLFNEGIAACIAAADRFDRTKDCRFSTYAAWWILSQLQEAVHRDIYTVKIGRSRNEKRVLRLLGTARNILGPNLDSSIIERIAEFSGTSPETIEQIDGAMASRSVSLNATFGSDGDEGGVEVGDMVEDESWHEFGPEARLLNADQRRVLERLFSRLTDRRAAQILRDRWLNEEDRSLKEIGEDFGVSAERIRQIERDALRQIRLMIKEDKTDMRDLLTT